ncbi:MAG: ABC transporter substrate-binding protein [Desulfatiglandales bacterium]
MKGLVICRPSFVDILLFFLPQGARRLSSRLLTTLITALSVGVSTFAFGIEAARPEPVAVLFTLQKPFVEAVEGLSEVLKAAGVEADVFTLDDYAGKKRDVLNERMSQKPFRCHIGVGPQAARYIWSELDLTGSMPLYTMVLNPDKVLPPTHPLRGISLNIPVHTQVDKIADILPTARRIGLLYDPRYNAVFFDQARWMVEWAGRTLVPLTVSSSGEIPALLEGRLTAVDALWIIPDPTVISESIIQYIIREALLSKVPVIGYNSFFHESGALMSFIFDYRQLGRQTGELVLTILRGDPGQNPDPVFSVWINRGVAQKIGIPLAEGALQEGEKGP